jgi:hypothetical protein
MGALALHREYRWRPQDGHYSLAAVAMALSLADALLFLFAWIPNEVLTHS